MSLILKRLIFAFIVSLALGVIWAKAQNADTYAQLIEKGKIFNELSSDFVSFSKTLDDGRNTRDSEIAIDFARISLETQQHIFSVLDLIDVYEEISCKSDRNSLKTLIEKKIASHAKDLDSGIKMSNTNLGFARVPVIVTSGTKVKDELRSLKTLLISIKLQP